MLQLTRVEDRDPRALAENLHVVGHVEVAALGEVVESAPDREHVGAGRELDGVRSRQPVRGLDRSAQGALLARLGRIDVADGVVRGGVGCVRQLRRDEGGPGGGFGEGGQHQRERDSAAAERGAHRILRRGGSILRESRFRDDPSGCAGPRNASSHCDHAPPRC